MDVVFFVAGIVLESLVERLIISDLLEKVVFVSARLGMKVLDVKVEVDCTPVELLLISEADRAEFPLNILMAVKSVSDDVIAAPLIEVMILDAVEEEAEIDESSNATLAQYNVTQQHSRTYLEVLIVIGY